MPMRLYPPRRGFPLPVLLGATAYPRTLSETVAAPTDSPGRLVVYARASAETVGAPTDSVARAAAYARAKAESISAPGDAMARVMAYVRALPESQAAPSDAVVAAQTHLRSIAENIAAPSDGPSRTATYARASAEAISAPTDAIARLRAAARAIAESVSAPTDAVVGLKTRFINLTESLAAPLDAMGRAAVYLRSVVEAVTAPVDAVNVVKQNVRSISETVGAPTDDVTRSLPPYLRAVSEFLFPPTDAVVVGGVVHRILISRIGTVIARLGRTVWARPAPATRISFTVQGEVAMSDQHFPQGAKLLIGFSFALVDPLTGAETPIDPDVVKFGYVPPGRPRIVHAYGSGDPFIVKDATGSYHVLLDTTPAASEDTPYELRAWSTGNGQDASPLTLWVDPTNIVMT